jgi:hypothetical protein
MVPMKVVNASTKSFVFFFETNHVNYMPKPTKKNSFKKKLHTLPMFPK